MLLSRIDVLWTTRYRYEPGWSLQPHRHKYFQVSYIAGEAGSFLLGGETHPIDGPALFLIKPGEMHGLAAASTIDTFDLKLNLPASQLRQKLLAARAVIAPAESETRNLFEQIRAEGEFQRPYYRDLCGLYAAQILLGFLRRRERGIEVVLPQAVPEGTGDALLSRALEFIRKNYATTHAVAEIASRLACSERVLRRHFHASVGIGPLDFLHRYRIERAKELMQHGDNALKQIAEAVGFKNIHHFTRVFSEIEGTPPGAWRHKFVAGICKDVCIAPGFADQSWTVLHTPPERQGNGRTDRRRSLPPGQPGPAALECS